jgi:hypothetical protein
MGKKKSDGDEEFHARLKKTLRSRVSWTQINEDD